MFRQAVMIVLGVVCWAMPASAEINLELRPASQVVWVGDTVGVGLYAVSDDQTDQLLMSTQVIIAWDPGVLVLLGLDGTGAVPLQLSAFSPDPFGLNEVVPPQDGDGLYVALGPLGDPVVATPAGTLLTTFRFVTVGATVDKRVDKYAGNYARELFQIVVNTDVVRTYVAPAMDTSVDILESAGAPETYTIVYDGTVPNLIVTGELFGATITPAQCLSELLTLDPEDYAICIGCMEGPGNIASALAYPCPCPSGGVGCWAVCDCDGDGDVDLADFAAFQRGDGDG